MSIFHQPIPPYTFSSVFRTQHSAISIQFNESATNDSIRDAIFDFMKKEPYANAIAFENLPLYQFFSYYFAPFVYEYIDLSHVSENFNRIFDIENFPCKALILPDTLKNYSIFPSRFPFITQIYLPRFGFIPVNSYCPIRERPPIHVSSNAFSFIVSKDNLSMYLSNSDWAALCFISPDGKIFRPTFNGLYCHE